MLRELVARFSSTIAERRASVRKRFNIPVRVSFTPEKTPVRSNGHDEDAFLSGETTDLSETGIGFLVSSIRIKEKYLVGQDRDLNLDLDIIGRKVRLVVRGVRYERIGIHQSTEKYLVGAQIVSVNEQDLPAYQHFLRSGSKAKANLSSAFESGLD
ncbi:MAG TPA: PilZ domain-containing protein [Pyrinomonadaceae bacterium]|nr:PilZ domain-containing protein [Pyrinomonadaceae bacterium]